MQCRQKVLESGSAEGHGLGSKIKNASMGLGKKVEEVLVKERHGLPDVGAVGNTIKKVMLETTGPAGTVGVSVASEVRISGEGHRAGRI